MIIDSSALVAIVLGESTAERLAQALRSADRPAVSAATVVEAGIVVEAKQGPDAARDLDLLIERSGMAVVPLDAEQATLARIAWRRFGKGRHPARLNLGDCFSYALAKARAEPLLFVGGDFSQTDIAAALS